MHWPWAGIEPRPPNDRQEFYYALIMNHQCCMVKLLIYSVGYSEYSGILPVVLTLKLKAEPETYNQNAFKLVSLDSQGSLLPPTRPLNELAVCVCVGNLSCACHAITKSLCFVLHTFSSI